MIHSGTQKAKLIGGLKFEAAALAPGQRKRSVRNGAQLSAFKEEFGMDAGRGHAP